MTYYRHRNLQTVVDTTKEAEFDVALYHIGPQMQERIAQTLKETPRGAQDRLMGDIRLRRIGDWDVMFVIAKDPPGWVITVSGVTPCGEDMESTLGYL